MLDMLDIFDKLKSKYTTKSNKPKISLIANVNFSNSRLIVGQNGELVSPIKKDLAFFKTVTMNSIVVMGRRTWFSLPQNARPLVGRVNIVITNNPDLLPVNTLKRLFVQVKNNPAIIPIKKVLLEYCGYKNKNFKIKNSNVIHSKCVFMTLLEFEKWFQTQEKDVFIIGGGELYNTFLQTTNPILKPSKLYITEVKSKEKQKAGNLSTIDYIPSEYFISSISEKYNYVDSDFRFLTYHLGNNGSSEQVYIDLLSDTLENGKTRLDRTNTGTLSVFGRQTKIDISKSIPILTTKRIPWKSCIEELLWFLRGDTCSKILEKKGVNIWKGNTSREFLDARGLEHYPEGVLGPGYSWQWRFFGAKYSSNFADTSKINTDLIGGVDQIEEILHQLKTDPFSRRIVLTAWNPTDSEKMALVACHLLVTFYVEQDSDGVKHLSCHYIMRSNDLFLGAPWNIMSYATLTYIFAMKAGMVPKELVYSCSDAHIYSNHTLQVEEQIKRPIRSAPCMILNESIKNKRWQDISVDDFEVVGYFPDKAIKGKMAV